MDQKNCVGNILFFKNVWRGPLCSRRAGSLVIKLFTWDLGGYNVKSVNRIKQNRELNQCFLHPVHCHNCRAVNCFFQTLKILLWTCEDQIGADTIFQRSVFIACSFKKKKKDKTGTCGANTPLPDLPCYWITRSVCHLGSPFRGSPRGRKGLPGKVACPQSAALFKLPLAAAMGSDFLRGEFFLETGVIL